MNEVYVYVNEDGYLDGWGDGYSENAVSVVFEPEADLFRNYQHYKYENGEFNVDLIKVREIEARNQLVIDKEQAKKFLDESKVTIDRYKDEAELGLETTLSEEEYKTLLRERVAKAKLLQGE